MMRILKHKKALFFAFLRLLGRPSVRLLVITLFFGVSIYLGYINAYIPLTNEIELPIVISGHNMRIDAHALDVATAGTLGQQEYTVHSFGLYRSIFSNGPGQ